LYNDRYADIWRFGPESSGIVFTHECADFNCSTPCLGTAVF
jgi:hypothetical protein